MLEPIGVSVTIFMPDEEPNGLRIVEMLNWSGQGIVFPKTRFARASKQGALKQTGVYVLRGLDQDDQPIIYVGEGENVSDRLAEHLAKKDFWTLAAAFVSKDSHLNKAHVKHLEARLWEIADRSKRCSLDNGNQPSLPNLADSDRAFAEHFLNDVQICLSAVGIHEFEELHGSQSSSTASVGSQVDAEFSDSAITLNRQGVSAHAVENLDGQIVVLGGSRARKKEAPGFANHPNTGSPKKRRQLIEQGALEQDPESNDHYILASDQPFTSLSQAAEVLVGGFVSGTEYWMKGDLTVREWREKLAEATNDDA